MLPAHIRLLQSERFSTIFPFSERSFLEALLEDLVIELLAGRQADRARDFTLAWAERRTASWADAARLAESKAASEGHLPAIRGQLRYHLGERALSEAASSSGLGSIPLRTNPPGGTFIVARVGRFAIISATVRAPHLTPRRSLTRKHLAQPNIDLDPQYTLALNEKISSRGTTELAYFGCVIVVPSRKDHTIPGQLHFAVPSVSMDSWIVRIPLDRLHALLQKRCDDGMPGSTSATVIPDRAFPRFRFPKPDEQYDDGGEK
jgi:hypothetical protein